MLSHDEGPELMFAAKVLFQKGFFFLYVGKVLLFLYVLLIYQISRTFWHHVNSAQLMPSRERGNGQTSGEMSIYKMRHQKA